MSLLSSRVYNTRQVGIVIPHLKQRKGSPEIRCLVQNFPGKPWRGQDQNPAFPLNLAAQHPACLSSGSLLDPNQGYSEAAVLLPKSVRGK